MAQVHLSPLEQVLDVLRETPELGLSLEMISMKLEKKYGFGGKRIVATQGIKEGVKEEKIVEVTKINAKYNAMLRSYYLKDTKE